jgi:hypothetical protein
VVVVWFARTISNRNADSVEKTNKGEADMKKNVIVVVAVLLVSAAGAWAQDDVIDGVMKACEPEINAYCSQVTLGEGRLLACFYAHEDKLSGRCQYALYQGVAALEDFAAAITHLAVECENDLLEFCGDVELGEGRVGTCLLEHKDQVDEACRNAMDDVGLEVVDEE